jgi:signal transduction histidine kinase
MCISDFLQTQNQKIEELKANQKSVCSMISLSKSEDRFQRSDLGQDQSFYNVKTMKVIWEKNADAYMHIFIDMTNIKKLEEEKAKYTCQKIMFASVSHEFRTPLNVFHNSLYLIKLKLDSVVEVIRSNPN